MTDVQTRDNESAFDLRRAIERLREGLFDPVAVRLLTARESRLKKIIDRGFQQIDQNKPTHLCICGAYGQGKSHSLNYIHDLALRENFVTSLINLDPREIPFHDMRRVYQALVAAMRFPDTDTALAAHWRAWASDLSREDFENRVAPLLHREMPHVFRSVLTAMAQKTVSLSKRQRGTKKHASYRPREFPYLLSRVLAGDVVPVYRLRHALKYRQVDFYKDASLTCKGAEPHLQMIRGLGRLFQKMGYRGWVLLFDEGESISQVRVTSRSRSYQVLDRIFFPEVASSAIYPIFAFTDDFFHRVDEEEYDRVRIRNEEEIPYFEKDYASAWTDLKRYILHDLSAKEWRALIEKLMHLHAKAYHWHPPEADVRREMMRRLSHMQGQETRYRLKGLVDELDLAHQDQIL
ncbi:MAG: DUF2791 family P-loop domain-containing protein [Gemmatimonadota bacterium]|nr:DUF2791 family P-loop domain-containing protein [Gemmatimonadota bacterium]